MKYEFHKTESTGLDLNLTTELGIGNSMVVNGSEMVGKVGTEYEFPLQIPQMCHNVFMLNTEDHEIRTFIIDPGGSTSAAGALCQDGLRNISLFNIKDETEFLQLVKSTCDKYPVNAVIEDIPKFCGKNIPASRIFPLARSVGFFDGVFRAHGIPITYHTPRKWMATVRGLKAGLSTADRKRIIRNQAATLYPNLKPTLRQADALMLAHYHFSKK